MTAPVVVPSNAVESPAQAPAPVADPLAQLKLIKGPDYPDQSAADAAKIAWMEKCSKQADGIAQSKAREATRNILYDYGRQYLTFSKRSRSYEDLPLTDPTEFRVTANYIRPILRSTSQRMLSGPIHFNAAPRTNALDERDRAQLGASLVQSRFEQTNMLAKLDQALELSFCAGVSVLKGFWNPDIGPLTPATLKQLRRQPMTHSETGEPIIGPDGNPLQEIVKGPDGEPIVDTFFMGADGKPTQNEAEAVYYRPGDSDTAVRTVYNIRLNPDATAWDVGAGLTWLLDTDIIGLDKARELIAQYDPAKVEQVEPMKPGDMATFTMERLAASAALAQIIGSQAQPYPSVSMPRDLEWATLIQELWEMPCPAYKRGRLMVRVGNLIAYDGEFPNGVFPYTPIFDEPVPMSPWGRPRVNDAISPQDVINRQWTAIDAEMRLSGIGKYAAWDIPGIPEQITAEDRTVIRVPLTQRTANKGLSGVFHRLEPASVSGDRWKSLDAAKSMLFDILGYHEVSRGQVPPGVDSGVAIEHLLEEDKGQLGKATRALESSLLHWGRVQGQICRDQYADDVERWIPDNRPDMGALLMSVNGTDLPDFETLAIELVGFAPTSEVAQKAEVKDALEMGIIEPRQAADLLDFHRGLNPILESQGRQYIRARTENVAILRGEFMQGGIDQVTGLPALFHPDGRPFLLPQDDDPQIHMRVLDEIALDEMQPWPIRMAALVHKDEHRRAQPGQPFPQPGGAPGQPAWMPEAPPMPDGGGGAPPPPPPSQ